MLLFRSHFIQLIPSFLLSMFIITFVLSMDTVYKLINMIIERGIDVATVMLLLTYQLPQFLNMTLPYASLMSVVLFMSRLSTDFELTAMHAAGISSWNIGSVVILFGGVITLLGWLNSLWLTPMGYRAFEEEKFRLLKSQKNRTIQPKVLNFDFGGKVLYVQEKDENDQLKGVFLSERDLDEDSMITVSDTGFIEVREKEQDLVLNLEKGKIHLHEQESSYRIIDFEKLFYVFRSSQMTNEDKDGHVWGKPTSEIWNSQQFSERRELMMRLTTPAACFVICLTMFSLGIVEPRRGRSASYLRGLILITSYYILWMGANELMEDLSPLILWMPVVLTFIYGLYNLFKINFKLSGFFEALRSSAQRSFRKKIHG